jgi:hypothetical protein
MSTQTYDTALDFMPASKPSLFSRLIGGAAIFVAAISEGQAANVRYTQLKARGMDHQAAAGIVFSEHFGR